MKKSLSVISLVLAIALAVAVPVNAESRESSFFSSYGAAIYKTSSTTFEVWFDVDSNLFKMDEIGTSVIEVYRSADQNTWTHMRTYTKENYPDMIDENTGSHTGCVTYNYATPGYYYTAYVTFYAKNSTGTGLRSIYTPIVRM